MFCRMIYAFLLFFFSFCSFAKERAHSLDQVTVTATRFAKTTNETLIPVTVITRKDLEERQIKNVSEALREVPGISLSNFGGIGQVTTLSLRGTETDHTLVLVDGFKVGSATTGMTAFQDIPIDLIERIEVVRGPHSGLYGSEALGGVVQIFTRKGKGRLKPSLSVGGGSFGTRQMSAGVSGSHQQKWVSLWMSGIESAGFDACRGDPLQFGVGCLTREPDRDGYHNLSGSFQSGMRFDNGLDASVSLLQTHAKNEYDGVFSNQAVSKQQLVGGQLRFLPTKRWIATLTTGQYQDSSRNFKDGVFKSNFRTVRQNVSWQNDFAIEDTKLFIVGVDWQLEKVNSDTLYAVSGRHNKGIFAEYHGTHASYDLQFSARQDINQSFGFHRSAGASWGKSIGRDYRLKASFGSAFKTPTFNELYYPEFGNPHLKPEKSHSFLFGISNHQPKRQWSVDVYETRLWDLIAYDTSISLPNNIEASRVRGFEADYRIAYDPWELRANASFCDPRIQSRQAYPGNRLPRRSTRVLTLALDRILGQARVGATLHVEGGRYDDLANTVWLDGFTLVDLLAETVIFKDWRLQARIANLFNRSYETAALFNQPGRSFFIELHYQPQS